MDWLKYALKRLLMLIPVIICVTFILFVILSLAPGDVARMVLGADATAEQIAALNHELDVAGKEWLRDIDEHVIFNSFRPSANNDAWFLNLKDMNNIPRTVVTILEETPFILNEDDGEPSFVVFVDYLSEECIESLDFDDMTKEMEKEKFDTNEMIVMTDANLDIPKNMINAYIDQTIQLRKNLPHAMASLSLWKYYSSSIDTKLIDCVSTIQSIANNTFKYGRDLKSASGFFFMKIQSTYEKILKEEAVNAQNLTRKMISEGESAVVEELKKKGMNVTYPDRESFVKKMAPAYAKVAELAGKDAMDEVLNAVKANQ